MKTDALLMGCMGWMQVALGVTTLLLLVPVPVAAAHQSGALATLSLAMWLSHETQYLKMAKKLVK
jgi:cytochrome c oxidase assembly protein subunit 15